MTTNKMVVYESFDDIQRAALALEASGYFKDVTNKAQAIVKVMAGAELGIPPFASMSGIHIIQGKPALGANVLATLIKNDPRYNYRVTKLDDTVCTIQFYEDGQRCGVSEFNAEDARKANTKNMNKFPKNMLFARAISNGAKWFTPGIFGGAPVYTPEELGADVDGEGEVIDVTPDLQVLVDGKVEYTVEHVEDEPEPLPDDEQAIYEMTAGEWMKGVIALIDRYDNAPHVKNVLKQLGYTGVPKGNGEQALKRLEMYRALKAQAAKRDLEDAEQEPLFDDEAAAKAEVVGIPLKHQGH